MAAVDSPPNAAGMRAWLPRLLVLAAAIGLGLLLQRPLTARLAEIDALARTDVLAARAELASLLRVGGAIVFGFTGVTGVSIAVSARQALASGRFPPPGIWSWGARQVVTGPRALVLARVSLVLGALLVVCSAAAGALTAYAAAVLEACRAR